MALELSVSLSQSLIWASPSARGNGREGQHREDATGGCEAQLTVRFSEDDGSVGKAPSLSLSSLRSSPPLFCVCVFVFGGRKGFAAAAAASDGKWVTGSCGNQKEDEIIVDIPSDLHILPTDNPIQDIVSAIYSNIHDNYGNISYFQECAILTPTVDIVQQINEFVVDNFPGLEKVYFSSDSICRNDCQDGIDTDWLTTEFLNQITCSGIPKHALKLKKGVPIILLQNIDRANRLCNRTQLIVQDLGKNIIGAEILSGSNIGDNVFIPRMNLIPSDPGIPFKCQRSFYSSKSSFFSWSVVCCNIQSDDKVKIENIII
ncbi:hypothetical protein Ahy_A10g048447 [Arachis hypogaea]|uniref:DNA helicase Pif1-like 2B domain-containing protein n=1 Tax=Arachis hypogaea TaxID=3818 RepID=A0A445B546_ARAHY|nr:hypothetical protein Ahy_A10g048447 [Arachis hypogaea]